MNQIQGICVSGILQIDDKVLVLRRPLGDSEPGYWEFPKGKVEFDEQPKDAILREYLEETGLKIVINKIIDVYSWGYKRIDTNTQYHVAETVYGVELAPGESLANLKLTEHDDSRFVDLKTAESLEPMVDDRRNYLIDALSR